MSTVKACYCFPDKAHRTRSILTRASTPSSPSSPSTASSAENTWRGPPLNPSPSLCCWQAALVEDSPCSPAPPPPRLAFTTTWERSRRCAPQVNQTQYRVGVLSKNIANIGTCTNKQVNQRQTSGRETMDNRTIGSTSCPTLRLRVKVTTGFDVSPRTRFIAARLDCVASMPLIRVTTSPRQIS